jgi:hypothetical protein
VPRRLAWLVVFAVAVLAAVALPGAASQHSPRTRTTCAPGAERWLRLRPWPGPRTGGRGRRLARTLAGVAPVLALLLVATAFRTGGGPTLPAAAAPPLPAAAAPLDLPDAGAAARVADALAQLAAAHAAARWTPLAGDAQVVALYGYPGVPVMGLLGDGTAADVAREAVRRAEELDALNGPRRAIGALHLIVAVAQPLPMADGSYLDRLDPALIAAYVEAARAAGLLLFLDVQCGMADPLAEAERLAPFLAEPFVHLALDPEFAMRASGGVPGRVIGRLGADELNAVSRWLDGLVEAERLPGKLLLVHQFRADMLARTERIERTPRVELVIDMDGWGSGFSKLRHYEAFALAPYAQRAAIKLFHDWDTPLLGLDALLALERPPDVVIYQ